MKRFFYVSKEFGRLKITECNSICNNSADAQEYWSDEKFRRIYLEQGSSLWKLAEDNEEVEGNTAPWRKSE